MTRATIATLLVLTAPIGAQRTLAWTCGDQTFDHLGGEVAAAGDVDNDGTLDWAVGTARRASTNPGYVRVFSGRSGAVLWTVRGQINMEFGAAIAGIGDIDGDGHDDLAVGEPERGNGFVHLFSGRNGQLIVEITRPSPTFDKLGWGLAALGDLDGDGVPDFIATGDGFAHLYSGRTRQGMGGVPAENVRSERGPCVAAAGDLDGDLRTDFVVVGQFANDREVVAYSGAMRSLLHRWTRTDSNWDTFGTSLAGGGDVDGDGTPDLLIGTPGLRTSGNQLRGSVVAISGATGVELFEVHGRDHGYPVGEACSMLDDLNADGRDEFVVADLPGALRFFDGRSATVLVDHELPYDSTIRAIAGLGDLDADGFDDLAVGLPFAEVAHRSQGCVEAISSRILARARIVGGGCGQGTALPELHATRPVLGHRMTVFGDRTPPRTTGLLFLGPVVEPPFGLYADVCVVHVDIGHALQIPLPASPSWSFDFPIPPVQQLSGIDLGMQAIWAPTLGVLGFDLTSAVIVQLGS